MFVWVFDVFFSMATVEGILLSWGTYMLYNTLHITQHGVMSVIPLYKWNLYTSKGCGKHLWFEILTQINVKYKENCTKN